MKAAPGRLSEFSVPVERQQQIGVTYAVAERKPLRRVDPVGRHGGAGQNASLGVRGAGGGVRAEAPCHLAGRAREEGQPLLTIYSPELLDGLSASS